MKSYHNRFFIRLMFILAISTFATGCTKIESKNNENVATTTTTTTIPTTTLPSPAPSSDSTSKPSTKEKSYSEKVEAVFAARKSALTILDEAIDKGRSDYFRNNYLKMRELLSNAQLLTAGEKENFENCYFGVMAFTIQEVSDKIAVCRILLEMNEKYISQALIHESGHIAGHWNECEATELEIGAMEDSGVGLEMKNDYIKTCDFSSIKH